MASTVYSLAQPMEVPLAYWSHRQLRMNFRKISVDVLLVENKRLIKDWILPLPGNFVKCWKRQPQLLVCKFTYFQKVSLVHFNPLIPPHSRCNDHPCHSHVGLHVLSIHSRSLSPTISEATFFGLCIIGLDWHAVVQLDIQRWHSIDYLNT